MHATTEIEYILKWFGRFYRSAEHGHACVPPSHTLCISMFILRCCQTISWSGGDHDYRGLAIVSHHVNHLKLINAPHGCPLDAGQCVYEIKQCYLLLGSTQHTAFSLKIKIHEIQ